MDGSPRRRWYSSQVMRSLFLISLTCLFAVALSSEARIQQERTTAPLLVVVNQGDKNISLLDPAAGRQLTTISEDQTTQWGHEVAVSPHGQVAYVPIYGNSGVGRPGVDGHQMLAVDIPSRQIIGKVDFGRGVRPHCVVYDPVSDLLYVTTEITNSVTIVDPRTLKIVGSILTTQPQSHMLAISHDGRRGYTANVSPGSVSVLDIVSRKTVAVIPVSGNTQRIAISRDDKLVFTADQTKPQLAVIDTSTNRIKTWIPLPATGYGAAATLDGKWLLVATQASIPLTPGKVSQQHIEPPQSSVAIVDLATLKVVRTILVPGAPQEILVSPDGESAYVSCMVRIKDVRASAADRIAEKEMGQVAVIDLRQWNVRSLIDAGVGADGLAWAAAP
jgi:DNA-binding beta-propeller fold protein YncE